jgi:hypothetical protein
MRTHIDAEMGGRVCILSVLVGTASNAGEGVVVSEVARGTCGDAGVVRLVAVCVVGALRFAGEGGFVCEKALRTACDAGQVESVKVENQ